MARTRRKAAGRPPEFDRKKALDSAMRVFSQKGYEGTSLEDLTSAMGICPPSLYAAFGNKQKLFEQSVERYLDGPISFMKDVLNEKTAYEVAVRLLRESAEFLARPDSGAGFMTIEAALVGGEESKSVRRKLTQYRLRSQDALRDRFERAKREGDLPKKADAAALARFVSTIFQGMSVQAINGATREQLLMLGEIAMNAWPGVPVRAK